MGCSCSCCYGNVEWEPLTEIEKSIKQSLDDANLSSVYQKILYKMPYFTEWDGVVEDTSNTRNNWVISTKIECKLTDKEYHAFQAIIDELRDKYSTETAKLNDTNEEEATTTKIISKIDCFVEFEGATNPFTIQPNTKVGRMKEVLQSALAIDIKSIMHYTDLLKSSSPHIIDIDSSKLNLRLIEDYNIDNKHLILVIGEKKYHQQNGADAVVEQYKYYEKYIKPIKLVHEQKTVEIAIHETATVQTLYDQVQHQMNIEQDTVTLYYNDKELNDKNKNLVNGLGFKENDMVKVEGNLND